MLTVIFIFFYVICLIFISFENSFKIDLFKEYWKRSFNFKGITKRGDFWIIQAWLLLHSGLLVIVGICLFKDIYWVFGNPYYSDGKDIGPYILMPIYGFSIVSSIQSISLQVRRLRDAAKNPWWILISFVPFVGGIVLLIFYLSPSRTKRLPMTLQDRLNEVEDLLTKGTIDKEEYKYMRKQILSKHIN